MIDSIGIDIVENERIKNSINENFLDKILTTNEKKIYNNKTENKKIDYLCGRFAAKEAIIKALSKFERTNFKELEILNTDNGTPIINYKKYKILISISHEKKYTIAQAIVLK